MDNIAIGLFGECVYAVIAFLAGYLWNKSRGLAEKQRNSDRGIRILLKIQLKRIHHDAVQKGYVTYSEQAFAEEIYVAYHGLGGNGQGTALIKSIREMKVSYDDTDD